MRRSVCPDAEQRTGVTLIELLVVLAILGVVTAVTGLAFRGARPASAPTVALRDCIAAARHEAITTGRSVTISVMLEEQPHAVTAFADGRVLTDLPPVLDSTGRLGRRSTSPDAKP